jgi:peptidyl-prolyl cis-trans isomerase C
VQFALAGGLLFAADAIRTTPDREMISVTREIADSLVRTREELSGVPVTNEERPAIVAGYISEEILLREAYARNLHRQDGLVRKRLLEMMRFMLIEEPAEPTTSELQAHLAAHRAAYEMPPVVTFSQVYFAGTDGRALPDASRVLARLQAGADFRKMGESFWLGRRLEGYAEPQLAQLFGPVYASSVLALPLKQWAGPIRSTRGVHFVRVDERRPAAMPAFSDLAPALRADWIALKREELLQKKVDELRAKYRIEIAPGANRP